MTANNEGVPVEFCAKCELCGHELDTRQDGVHQWMEGWMQRDQGSHDIFLPEKRAPRWAHSYCVENAPQKD